MGPFLRRVALVSIGVLLAIAPAASAELRYAGADSGKTATPCTQASPCDLRFAAEEAVVGDEVVVLPGAYGTAAVPYPGGQLTVNADVLRGLPGRPPKIFVETAFPDRGIAFGGDEMRDIELVKSGTGHGILAGSPDLVVERVRIRAAGVLTCGSRGVWRDSLCINTGDGPAFRTSFGEATLVNMTAIGQGAGSVGVTASSSGGAAASVQLVNTIAQGGSADVSATIVDGDGSAVVTATNSAFETTSTSGAGTTAVPNPAVDGNTTADPMFVDPSLLDFHLGSGSPLRDAGASTPLLGGHDLDYTSRVQGNAPDMGAYEFFVDSPEPPPSPSPSPSPSPPMDTTNPGVSGFALARTRFRVGRRPTALTARRHPVAKVGSAFLFGLSESADVEVAIERRSFGLRIRGRRCLAATRRNRIRLRRALARTGSIRRLPGARRRVAIRRAERKRRCARGFVPFGTITRRGLTGGRNRIVFTGRLGRRALPPGPYRASIVATDAAGNASRPPARAAFRIVKR